MANVVDQDQQWLLSCLSATLDPNQEVRSFAEASLDQASRQSVEWWWHWVVLFVIGIVMDFEI
ncbi:importin-9-like protein, partial [Trifolium pratense]